MDGPAAMLRILLVLVAAYTAQTAPNNCSTRYQDALKLILNLKETCREAVYKDCCEASEAAKFGAELMYTTPPASGVNEINHVCGDEPHVFHTSIPAMQARCSLGGWTVVLRRNASVPERVNFTRAWNDYKHGFGDLNTEFWYGLNNIHCLTSRQQVDLRIELKYGSGREQTYNYKHFVVGGPENNYTLHVGQLQQPCPGRDNMAYHNGHPFTTYDRDNDRWSSNNCALSGQGGWWFNFCSNTVLTKPHPNIYWHGTSNIHYVEMKVRPKQCAT